jgi:hypothetical protein
VTVPQNLFPDGHLVEQDKLSTKSPGAVLGMADSHHVHGSTTRFAEVARAVMGASNRPADRSPEAKSVILAANYVVDPKLGGG